MSKIVLKGRWLWIWGTWHALWIGGLLWAGAAKVLGLDPTYIFVYFSALYTAFFPPEIIGAIQDSRSNDDVARTMSEFRQYLPVMQGKGPGGVGWNLVGYSGVIDGLIVGRILYEVWPLLGAVAGTFVALVLSPHFGWRGRVG